MKSSFGYKVIGNFGVSFFSPLVGITIADDIFTHAIGFLETLVVSAISSSLTLGMFLSKEALKRSEANGKN